VPLGWGTKDVNQRLYYDPGRVEDFYQVRPPVAHSMWNLGFYRGDREEGLVIGFLENKVAEGHLTAWYDRIVGHASLQDGFALIVESTHNQGRRGDCHSGQTVLSIAHPSSRSSFRSGRGACVSRLSYHVDEPLQGGGGFIPSPGDGEPCIRRAFSKGPILDPFAPQALN
jgi:hypothetical protein